MELGVALLNKVEWSVLEIGVSDHLSKCEVDELPVENEAARSGDFNTVVVVTYKSGKYYTEALYN